MRKIIYPHLHQQSLCVLAALTIIQQFFPPIPLQLPLNHPFLGNSRPLTTYIGRSIT